MTELLALDAAFNQQPFELLPRGQLYYRNSSLMHGLTSLPVRLVGRDQRKLGTDD